MNKFDETILNERNKNKIIIGLCSIIFLLLFLFFVVCWAYDIRRVESDSLRAELFFAQNNYLSAHEHAKIPVDCNGYGAIHCGGEGEFCCTFPVKRNGFDYSNDCFLWGETII